MSKVIKRISFIILAVVTLAVAAFGGIYFTRILTIGSIEQLTDYRDGYNLYSMDIKYDYSLDDIIDYGCTSFTLTDTDGDVHMGRNYDFRKACHRDHPGNTSCS